MSTAPYVTRLIQHKYLEREFRDALYGLPMGLLFGKSGIYGSVVLTNFSTGGYAQVLCTGYSNKTTTIEELEKKMETSIDVSYAKDDNSSFGVNMSFDGRNYKKNQVSKDFSSMKTSYRLTGGAYSMNTSFSIAKDLENVSIDLSSWAASMNDPQTHVIADIEAGGLKSISNYISEINFKKHVEEGFFQNDLKAPYIEITWGKLSPSLTPETLPFTSPRPIYMALRTRHNDWILMRPINQTNDRYWEAITEEEFNRKAQEISNYIKQYYDLDIMRTHQFMKFPIPLPDYPRPPLPHSSSSSFYFPVVFRIIDVPFYGFDHTKLFRCKHPNYYNPAKGDYMQYLCYTNGRNVKLAFAIYEPYLLDTYGIRSLFESAPEKTLSVEELSRYTIVGL